MPRGVYPRKKHKKHDIIPAAEFPIEAIPERPTPVQRQQRLGIEPALVGLCHRMLDQQERLMDLLSTSKAPRKYTKRKGKVKA